MGACKAAHTSAAGCEQALLLLLLLLLLQREATALL